MDRVLDKMLDMIQEISMYKTAYNKLLQENTQLKKELDEVRTEKNKLQEKLLIHDLINLETKI